MLRLIEIRKDVWLESLKAEDGLESITEDLPEQNDVMVVLLWSKEERLPRGIFYRINDGLLPVLVEVSLGVSEVDPALFKDYARRKTPHGKLKVILESETRMANMEPNVISLHNPNIDMNVEREGHITISSNVLEPVLELLEEVIDAVNPPLIYVKNPNGLDLQALLDYVDAQTEYVLNMKEYILKGE